jgi:broad specificity phosphatase PhoE
VPAIYLLRHGQASFGTDDYDVLSERGAAQARVAGRELIRRGLRTPMIVSGTLLRQRDTAAIVADLFGVPLADSDPRWDEMPAHGLVEQRLGGSAMGLTSAQFQLHLDVAMAAWIDDDTDAWREFSGGAIAALEQLGRDVPKGGSAVVATSSGVIAAVCGRILGTGSAGVISLNRVSINSSITTIAASERGLSLISYNDHAHFLEDRDLLTNR